MTLLEFYREVVTSLGLKVDKEDFIRISHSKGDDMMMVDGSPWVIPTATHISSIYHMDDDGEVHIVKTLFNPLSENIIKGDSASLKKIKQIVEQRLAYSAMVAGHLLLTVASDKKFQKDVNFEISKFLSEIGKAKAPGIKDLVDSKSLKSWMDLYTNANKQSHYLSVTLKKGGKYENVSYNRLATLHSALFDSLAQVEKDPTLYEVKLRNKDVKIFNTIFEFLFEDMNDLRVLSVGSNDKESPGFVSLFTLYLKVASRVNEVIEALGDLDKELSDSAKLDLNVELSELEDLQRYKSELKTIPSDLDITRGKNHAGTSGPETTTTVQSNAPETPLPYNPIEDETDPVRKANALRSGFAGGVPTMGTGYNVYNTQPIGYQPTQPMMPMPQPIAQPMMPMQQPMMQPMMQMPMQSAPTMPLGINTAQQVAMTSQPMMPMPQMQVPVYNPYGHMQTPYR